MTESKVILTSRLILRPPASQDIHDILTCVDEAVLRVISLNRPYTLADAEQYVNVVATAGWQNGNRLVWGIYLADKFIGQLSLTTAGDREMTIGYWLGPAARGRGYLPEAAAAVIEYAFATDGLDLTRLRWNAYVENIASASVAARLGFRYAETARIGALGWNRLRDAWVATLGRDDSRVPQVWPVLALKKDGGV